MRNTDFVLAALVLVSGCGGSEFFTAYQPGGAPGAGGSSASGGSASGGHAGISGGVGTGGQGTGGKPGVGGGPGTGGAAGSGGGITVDAGGGCTVGQKCVAPPPAGWTQVGWFGHDVAASCPNALLPTKVYDVPLLPQPVPAKCMCGCESDVRCTADLTCGSASGGPDTCHNAASFSNVGPSCSTISVPVSGAASCGIAKLAGTQSCPVKGVMDAPAPWTKNALVCLGPAASAPRCAEGGVCAPVPPTGAVGPCVSASGDVPCPTVPSPFVRRTVLHQAYDDARSCDFAACTCQSASVPGCECVTNPCGVAIGPASCAATSPTIVPPDGLCYSVQFPGDPTQWGVVLLGVDAPAVASCSPLGTPTATGQVAPTGPITMCCM